MYDFYITAAKTIYHGTVREADLVKLWKFFYKIAHGYHAKVFELAGGSLIAERNERFVMLQVIESNHVSPSCDFHFGIEDAMDLTFW